MSSVKSSWPAIGAGLLAAGLGYVAYRQSKVCRLIFEPFAFVLLAFSSDAVLC
jgi:hypothetical protein